ncbi:uncharacterized protein B0H18DRAFT_658342 [Fomitopsis serialis]|uniref:uncharacterized protein n=1 Tax=Fomitopsis serialis TaxID=139415 RepID=UPI002008D66E|nr:uncharacterized protein B0H18DRAFT_658342 [Neoantrodia serialis]KAH9919047.1 hypothetical protein B0H18DRAFT_658342 [Neoantrodia serialis]
MAARSRMRELGSELRATPFVSMLPNETFIEIIRLASADSDGWCDNTMVLARSMGVCRYWRDLIINTPLLWTRIELSNNTQYIRQFLARSGSASITLSCPYLRRTRLSVLAPLLEPHYARVARTDFRFFDDEDAATLPAMLSSFLPCLASISLRLYSFITLRQRYCMRLESRHLPSLRSLSLERFTLDLTPDFPLSRLVTLRLSLVDLPGDHQCLVTFLDMLEACKSLENFSWGKSGFKNYCELCEHGARADRIIPLHQCSPLAGYTPL